MHVVFVLPRFFPYRGGYENSLLALAKYMVEHGHRATVFTTVANDLEAFWLPGFKTFPEEQTVVDGVTIHRFPICYNKTRRRAARVMGLAPYWRWKAQHWRPSFRVPGLSAALRETDADLIHIGPLPYNGVMYAGLSAGERRHVPVVATPCSHLGEPGNREVEQHYLGSHQVEMLRHCQKVFCMTQTERERLTQLGLPPQKLTTTPFGINLASVTGGDPEFLLQRYGVAGPVVLHLGMKAFDKGSETVVEAMKLLWARGSDAWLVMAGPSLSTFDAYIAQPAKDCPKLLNLPPFADLQKRDFLASATIVAQPSRVESLGLVLMEAWANRKPVVAANIDVSRELITAGAGGAMVPFGDAGQLAQQIERLLADANLRESMGLGGYQVALGYASETCCQRIVSELERVVEASGERRR
jgi:glycogen(starch) synthase